jgi:hypothetical protein
MLQTALLLLTAPVNAPAPSADMPLDRAAVEVVDSTYRITGYDRADEDVAAVSVWYEPDGDAVMLSEYTDGYAQYTIGPDGSVTIDSNLDPAIVALRAGALANYVDWDSAERSKLMCGVAVVATAVSTASLNPFGAAVGVVGFACNCAPLISDKAVECP